MKKLKFLGTAVLAASLLFAGCSSPEVDDPTGGKSNPSPAPVEDTYKYYLVSSPKQDSNKAIADWGAGSTATPNDDGTYTISASGSMWNGIPGICAPFTGFDAGTLANYEYIVFTLDTSDFEIDTTGTGGNYGVNVKIPDIQKEVSEYASSNTYRVPLSIFEAAPASATEFAIIIGGTGTVKLNELYLEAEENPNEKPVTGITITPASASLEQGGTQQFTVKDSNFKDRTSEVTYSLSGAASEGSTITNAGLLTVGTTAGNLTVTAQYGDFNASATITVMTAQINLVKNITLEKYVDSTGGDNSKVSIANGVVTVAKPAGTTGWGEWSSQLFLNISAESGNIFESGKKYYISVTVESDVALNGCVWKGDDNAGYLLETGINYVAGEAKTLKEEITFSADFASFQCILAFGANADAANIKVSNITVYDITE